jgi:hypothetical protein
VGVERKGKQIGLIVERIRDEEATMWNRWLFLGQERTTAGIVYPLASPHYLLA